LPEKIIKRDGRVVTFDQERIINAIFKAAQAVGGADRRVAGKLSQEVVNIINENFRDRLPSVEEVQDIVEKVLIENGHAKTAKAYILYRKQHEELRNFQHLLLNTEKMFQEYLGGEDWRINENSNMNYSLQGLNNHIISAVTSKYWLEKVYPEEIREAHRQGDFHIHDLGLLAPYCCGWDLADLLENGFSGVSQKVESGPPRHFRTALGQIVNFFYTMQGESAGAQALANFDTYLAPFIRYDGMNYREVKQAMQEFIFNLNVPTRVGFQTPFVNITMDVTVSPVLKDQPVLIGGEIKKETYGEFQVEMDMLNLAFSEVMMEGDARGRIFTFPIPTYNITPEFNWQSPMVQKIMEMTARYGIPYFANFINADLSPEDVRSMCLFPEEDILIRENGIIRKLTLGELFEQSKGQQLDHEWFEVDNHVESLSLNPKSGRLEWVEIKRMLRVTDRAVVHIRTKDGKTMRVSPDHLVAVYTKGGIITKKACDIDASDFLLVMRDGSNALNQETELISKELDRWGISTDSIEWLRNADFAVVEVADSTIEQLDYDQVFYDIELGKNHYFVHSQGNITHNCCRLRLDNRELRRRGGGLFGANPLTGSIGVVTINIPRLGYLSKDEGEFFARLEKLMEMARNSLLIKRNVLEKMTELGLYPYSRHYLRSVKERFGGYWFNHFNTIGLVGMNEGLLNFLGKDICSEEGRAFAIKVLDFMRNLLLEFQTESEQLFNLEATPAEGTAYRLAKIDKELYPDIITSGQDSPYYTNSTQLPAGFTDDVFSALDLQEELQIRYTGGTVFHIFLGERIEDIAACKKLLQRIMGLYRVPYVTITPTFSVCLDHGYLTGEQYECTYCGKETEVWSRVVGFYRPVQNWNKGKQSEFSERKVFKI
jgi:ribonucleoside-triphosphate reductase